MADNNNMVSIATLDVNTAKAVKNVNELKEYIKYLKEQLQDEDATLEENKQTIGALTQAQNQLRDIMHTTALSTEELNGKLDISNASYNDLVHTMSELQKAWRATNDDAERNRLGHAIGEINDKLKGFDKSIGNYKRNVGNYQSALDGLAGGFTATAGGASAIINPLKSVNAGFTALSATPAIAILGLLANLLNALIKNLKSSEDNINAVTMAFAPFKVAGDVVARVMQALAGQLAKVGEWLTKIVEKLGLMSDEMKARKAEAQERIQLMKDTRAVNEANAESEGKIAELRAKMAEKDKYSQKERLAFAQQWKEELMKIEERNLSLARRELALAQAEASHSQNSTEAMDKLSEAKIKVINATTQYNEQLRRANSEIASLSKNTESAVKATEKASETLPDFFKTLEKAQKEWYEEIDARIKETAEVTAMTDAMFEETLAEVDAYFEELEKKRQEDLKKAKAVQDAKNETLQSGVEVASSVMSSLADIYEANAQGNENAEKRIKALRIGSALISTMQGAINAFMSCQESFPQPYATAIGALQAGAVTSAGMATIAKMKSTSVNGGGGMTAVMNAPQIATQIPTTYLQTTQAQEAQLSQSRRVVLVTSDLEANEATRVQIKNETDF